jgi:hydroxymethylbilane synthase
MRLTMVTRRSPLALAQSRAFATALATETPGLQMEELQVITSGDRFLAQPLQDLGGKGLFTKELEEALLDGRADFAVHSLKDMPGQLDERLVIACIPVREDPRDVLVSRGSLTLAALPAGARVGTSSLRRAVCLRGARPDLRVESVRGNVQTRLAHVREGRLDAVVLARAGLRRLGLESVASEVLEADVMLPACGQGALAIQSRADAPVIELLAHLGDPETATCVTAERAFLRAVGGSCRLPVAAHARHDRGELWLRVMLADDDGTNARFAERRIAWPAPTDPEPAEQVGADLGAAVRARAPSLAVSA